MYVHVHALKKVFECSSLICMSYCFLIIVLPEYPREVLASKWKVIRDQKLIDFLNAIAISVYLKETS